MSDKEMLAWCKKAIDGLRGCKSFCDVRGVSNSIQELIDACPILDEVNKDANPPWLETKIEEVLAMRHLKKDWDSYGGLPPRAGEIENATRMLKKLALFGSPEPIVGPENSGRVLITVPMKGLDEGVALYSDGEMRVLAEPMEIVELAMAIQRSEQR